jgi:hypothetical protein
MLSMNKITFSLSRLLRASSGMANFPLTNQAPLWYPCPTQRVPIGARAAAKRADAG